jgi:hypothetical protein
MRVAVVHRLRAGMADGGSFWCRQKWLRRTCKLQLSRANRVQGNKPSRAICMPALFLREHLFNATMRERGSDLKLCGLVRRDLSISIA